jgi:glycosyltransferase involved in cell wall biosynthesis
VPRVYIDLLREFGRQGAECSLIAAPGELVPEAVAAGIDVSAVDWSQRKAQSYELVGRALGEATAAFVLADPLVAHVLPAVAARASRTVVALHTAAPRLGSWFSERELAVFKTITHGLVESGRARILTIGEQYVSEYETVLGIDRSAVDVLRPATRTDAVAFEPHDGGGLTSIVSVCRLSPEKTPHIEASIELLLALLDTGRSSHLYVVGDGPWRAEAQTLCLQSLPPGTWTFEGSTLTPIERIRTADVVVASGVTVLEALAVGRPVVVVRTTPDAIGALGPVLTVDRFPAAARDAFGWRTRAPWSGAEVVSELQRLDSSEIVRLRRLVEEHHDVRDVAHGLLSDTDALPTPGHDEGLDAVGLGVAALIDQRDEDKRLADDLWVYRLEREGGDHAE